MDPEDFKNIFGAIGAENAPAFKVKLSEEDKKQLNAKGIETIKKIEDFIQTKVSELATTSNEEICSVTKALLDLKDLVGRY